MGDWKYLIREATSLDVEATFVVRAATRENSISRERLAALGITPTSIAEAMRGGSYRSWVCEAGGEIVGFCNAEGSTGEVLVLAVLSGHEGMGIGTELLSCAVHFLRSVGNARIWLSASPLASLRSHGFYRARGWSPTGKVHANGDEELELLGAGSLPLCANV